MILDRFSERYAPTGNLASEGVQNQLGRPHHDPIAVLIREAIQNCWDAHDPADPHILVRIELVCLDDERKRVLTEKILADPAPHTPMCEQLLGRDRPMYMLTISDRNTSGLGGPTRADVISTEVTESTDFVDFLRNIGQPPDKELGGGTFGYGKAALYRMSRLRTILVDTMCTHDGKPERRFIGACLGAGYEIKHGEHAGRYTGRHWWGRLSEDGEIADPLLDDEAFRMSTELGLPEFTEGQSGTTIAIPDFGTARRRSPEVLLDLIARAILWNFWPKMLRSSNSGRPAIEFSLFRDGTSYPLPDPRQWPPLDGFCRAMDALKAFRSGGGPGGERVFEIMNQNPKRLLGHAAFVSIPSQERAARPQGEQDTQLGHITETRCHHTAWMRDPELVVRYDPGPPPIGDLMDWAGVYLVSADVDRAYAMSEPPTHDDWIPGNLDERLDRMAVNVGLREVRSKANEFAHPQRQQESSSMHVPLGGLSRGLGSLLTGHVGRGADRDPVSNTKPIQAGPRVVEEHDSDHDGFFVEEDSPGAANSDSPAGRTKSPGVEAGKRNDAPGAFDTASETEAPPCPPGRPRVRTGIPKLDVVEECGCLIIPFTLEHGARSKFTRLSARLVVEIDGNAREESPPSGAPEPRVLFWINPGNEHVGCDEDVIETHEQGDWELVVELIDDAPVRVRIAGKAGEVT